jgi:hypothetical protein
VAISGNGLNSKSYSDSNGYFIINIRADASRSVTFKHLGFVKKEMQLRNVDSNVTIELE